jgi:hypothetical protein
MGYHDVQLCDVHLCPRCDPGRHAGQGVVQLDLPPLCEVPSQLVDPWIVMLYYHLSDSGCLALGSIVGGIWPAGAPSIVGVVALCRTPWRGLLVDRVAGRLRVGGARSWESCTLV